MSNDETTTIRSETSTGGDSRRLRTPHRWGVLAAAGVLGLGLVGCGGGSDSSDDAADKLAEKLAESGTEDADVNIDSDKGQVDVSTPDGEMSFGSGTELPDDFPSDIPFPEGSTITSALSSTDGGVKTWSVTGTLADADEGTFDDIIAQLTADGWTKTSDMSGSSGGGMGSTTMLTRDNMQLVVAAQIGIEGTDDSFSYAVNEDGA